MFALLVSLAINSIPRAGASELAQRLMANWHSGLEFTHSVLGVGTGSLAVEALVTLAEAERRSSGRFIVDTEDARAWITMSAVFGEAVVSGRVLRLKPGSDHREVAEGLDDEERFTWNVADLRLTETEREALRRAYPVLARAVTKLRPGVGHHMVIAQVAFRNFATAQATYGRPAILRAISTMALRDKFSRWWGIGERDGEDLVIAHTFIGIARYLRMPESAGFCSSRLTD